MIVKIIHVRHNIYTVCEIPEKLGTRIKELYGNMIVFADERLGPKLWGEVEENKVVVSGIFDESDAVPQIQFLL